MKIAIIYPILSLYKIGNDWVKSIHRPHAVYEQFTFLSWYIIFGPKYIWLTEDSNSVLSEGQNFWLVRQYN